MPQGGIVTTYSDITERVEAAEALARSNETLEGRVRERTAELLEVNKALAVAKRKADEANLDKTRFLAAASHDVLQPLNAARLYVTSMVERPLDGHEATLARNIDASLEAVEEILNVLIEIARLDTGRMEPDLTVFPLNEVLERLAVEFEPMARSKGLELRVVPTSTWVRSDRRLLRRVLQNLVSNGIKYTPAGKVLLGVRRRGDNVSVQVCDTGPGIPQGQALHHLQGVPAPGGDGELGARAWARAFDRRAHRQGAASSRASGVRYRGAARCSRSTCRGPRRALGAQATEPPAQPAGQLSGLRVVCIDNEPAVLQGMQTLLSGWGCTVITARSGDEALGQLQQGMQPPDIILADYHLDEGTGTGAIATLRAATHMQIPAVIITADHSAEVLREVRLKGHALLQETLEGCGVARPHAPAHLAAARRGCRIGAATLTTVHQHLTNILPFRALAKVHVGAYFDGMASSPQRPSTSSPPVSWHRAGAAH